ncbi:MAG: hypothetical protein CL424_18900 [Acidimicrobiaceae bacterium]|nr:hypothetical protein [Acidimicrobiaceae bacterium]
MNRLRPDLAELDTDRPLLVVGPRVRPVDVDFERLPADPIIFRCGPLDPDSIRLWGSQVDGYFPDSSGRRSAGRAVDGRFSIGLVFADTDISGSEAVDWCDIVSHEPELARLLMRSHRPGVVPTMVATGVCLGFTDIRIIDSDFGSLADNRTWIDPLANSGPGRSETSPGSERPAGHDVSTSLRFLLSCRDARDGVRVTDASLGHAYRRFLSRSAIMPPGDRFTPGLDPDPPYAIRRIGGNDLRCAFVTVCDNTEYLWGVRALANSLARHSDVPLILLTPPSLDLNTAEFDHPNVRPIPTTSLQNPRIGRRHQQRFLNTYTKLNTFALSFLDRAVYLDADTIVLRPIEHLFEHEHFAAAPDIGLRIESHAFNSGVFVCQPSGADFERMLDAIPTTESYDGGDQGFLNAFFDDVDWLPLESNVLRRIQTSLPDLYREDKAMVIHYVGDKPWTTRPGTEWSPLDHLWFGSLSEADKVRFIVKVRSALNGETTSFDVTGVSKVGSSSDAIQRAARQALRDARARGDRGDLVGLEVLRTGRADIAEEMGRQLLAIKSTSSRDRMLLIQALRAQGKWLATAKEMATYVAVKARNAYVTAARSRR